MEWSPEDSLVSFSKLERGAIMGLLLLIAVGGSSGYWMPKVWPKADEGPEDVVAFQAEIAGWEVRNQALVDSLARVKAVRDQRYADNRQKWNKPKWNTSPNKRTWPKRKPETVAIDYSVPFPALESVDANTVDTSVLFRMGVPPKIARRWVKFRERGGSFVRKEDVGKLYGMPDSTLNRIMPFIKTPDLKERKERKEYKGDNRRSDVVVNASIASSEELQKVRGIGAFYADRIVNYRASLGGFLSLDQVAETPGLREGAFETFKEKLTFTQQEPRFIHINEVSEWQLAEHPYITKKQAEIVILNRRNHGKYATRADLLETIILDTATVDRLMPYLDFR